ncbi:hypothetical protein EHF33_16365 (plasmid) [Deinococcus psychrotolerans]|uniref:Uncharacterized protein n=1 Tax=Deinococcus psychrotolerans TaxID=2489213 RepID=A0A3G8YRT4_9DEIO|nr:hypothetical protein [Deinococcus psychrotolerans]AZI44481.1 hypothetical protein EHF33_16325 [Deinococcus psychrotolerans]AZI44489.1 hypothetical protein EHF33_16365 [Deinococcus psychrotolerans]
MRTVKKNKTEYINEITNFSKKLDGMFIDDAGFKSIKCPSYFTSLAPSQEGDVKHCFVSMRQPEELIPLFDSLLESTTEISMDWRMDLGDWTTYRRIKGSDQEFSLNLSAPGLSETMRADPMVNKYKTVGRFFIGYEPKK